MIRSSRREMLCINAVAWAGTLLVVGFVTLDVLGNSLAWSSGAIGYVVATVLLAQMLLSGRGIRVGALLLAAAASAFPFWFAPAETWFLSTIAQLINPAQAWFVGMVELLAMPAFVIACSLIAGLLLSSATGSGAVGVQAVLAGVVAGVVALVPGDPTMIYGASGAMWCLIVFLSLSKWARNHASRLSRGPDIVCLGQSGPLASLVRGSAHEAEQPKSDAA